MNGFITVRFERSGSPLIAETRVSEELVEFSYADVLKSVYWQLKEAFDVANEGMPSPSDVADAVLYGTPVKIAGDTEPAQDVPVKRCPFDNYAEPCPVHTLKAPEVATEPTIRQTNPGEFVGACGIVNCLYCLSDLVKSRFNP